MRIVKRLVITAAQALVVAGVTGFVALPTIHGQDAPPVPAQGHALGQSGEHRADPCELVPDASGLALGHDKHCPPLGSSGGVARGDFNGDGFADLAIGVPFEDIGKASNAGAVNVIHGSSTGLTATSTLVPASQLWHQDVLGILDASESGDEFGAALASGDFNGDDYVDLAVAVPGERNAAGVRVGAVHVLYGSSAGLTDVGDQVFLASSFSTAFPGSALSILWADFNGDTFGDLAVEARRADGTPQVLVLRGSADGLTSSGSQLLTFSACDVGFCGEVYIADLVLAAGDFGQDGLAELVVGAPHGRAGSVENAGNVRKFIGSANGLIPPSFLTHQNLPGTSGDAEFEVAEFGDPYGAALAVGDFDGDTLLDLAIGVPGEDNGIRFVEGGGVLNANSIANGGVVHIFTTTTGERIVFEAQWAGVEGGANIFGNGDVEANDRNGSALAAGDFDGDGFADLAIGASGETLGSASAAGSVSILYGSANGLSVDSFAAGDRQFWTEASFGGTAASGDNFGAALSAWNFGRNHSVVLLGQVRTADLAVGIPRKDVSGITDAGAVRVIYGFTSGLATSTQAYEAGPLNTPRPGPSQLWHQNVTGVPGEIEADDRFGSAVY